MLLAAALAGVLLVFHQPLINAAQLTAGGGDQVIFEDGFESGDSSKWTAKAGQDSYPTGAQCHSGKACGAMTIQGGRDQQSVLWGKGFRHSGETMYVSGWWRFPKGFTWDPGGAPWGYEHKMIIINTPGGNGRVLVNLRGGGTSPQLAIHFERLDPYGPGEGISSEWSDTHWPADGAWHRLEVEILRVSGPGARARVWLDDQLAIDERGRVCKGACGPVEDVNIGAYSNQGAPRTQQFFVDDVLIASSFDAGRRPRPGESGGNPRPSPTRKPTPRPTSSPKPTPSATATPGPTTPPPASGCAGSQPGTLLCDGFESGNFARYGDVRNTGVFRFVNGPVASGNTALEARIAPGTLGENYANAFVGDHPLLRGGKGAAQQEVYLRARIRYSPGFDLNGGKLFIMNAFESWTAGYPGPNSFAPYYVTVQTIGGRVEALLHSKTSGRSVWRPLRQNQGQPIQFQTDRWYEIGLHLKLNTPGRADGIAEVFIDGRRMARYIDVNFRDRYTRASWNHLTITPLQERGVGRTRSIYYDDVVLSATPIAGAAPRG